MWLLNSVAVPYFSCLNVVLCWYSRVLNSFSVRPTYVSIGFNGFSSHNFLCVYVLVAALVLPFKGRVAVDASVLMDVVDVAVPVAFNVLVALAILVEVVSVALPFPASSCVLVDVFLSSCIAASSRVTVAWYTTPLSLHFPGIGHTNFLQLHGGA